MSSSVLYLEAEHEVSLAGYLAEFADLIGKGSLELFEQLGTTVAERSEQSGAGDPFDESDPLDFSYLHVFAQTGRVGSGADSTGDSMRSTAPYPFLDKRQSSVDSHRQPSDMARSYIQPFADTASATRLGRRG